MHVAKPRNVTRWTRRRLIPNGLHQLQQYMPEHRQMLHREMKWITSPSTAQRRNRPRMIQRQSTSMKHTAFGPALSSIQPQQSGSSIKINETGVSGQKQMKHLRQLTNRSLVSPCVYMVIHYSSHHSTHRQAGLGTSQHSSRAFRRNLPPQMEQLCSR